MRNNFYDELANRNFYEKTASTQEQVKNALESFTTEEMEAIAEELGLLSQEKTAEENSSLESKVLNQVQKQEKDDKEDKSNEAKVEGAGDKTEESQATGSEQSEESKTKEEKKESVNEQAAASAGTNDGSNTETTGDSSAGNNTGASVSDDEQKVAMVLAAYDMAAEKLASAGYSLADYVYSKVGDEKVACEVAESAEKLAFITDQNSLKVADDIIETMFNLLEQ